MPRYWRPLVLVPNPHSGVGRGSHLSARSARRLKSTPGSSRRSTPRSRTGSTPLCGRSATVRSNALALCCDPPAVGPLAAHRPPAKRPETRAGEILRAGGYRCAGPDFCAPGVPRLDPWGTGNARSAHFMATPAGLEPATNSLEGCCSNPLSYGAMRQGRRGASYHGGRNMRHPAREEATPALLPAYFPSSRYTGSQSGPGGCATSALARARNAAAAGSACAKRVKHSAAPIKSRARQRAKPST